MINVILNHRSIRKFKNIPVEQEILNKILTAGTRASTTGNMQAYSIIVTIDKQIKEKLWEYHFKQNMVLEAPVHLTFCADFNRFSKWCQLRKANPGYDNFLSFMTAAIDAILASQNVALAAESYGLGICYLGTIIYNADKFIEIFELPPLVVPVAAIVLGYPDEEKELTDRLPLEAIVHYEKYKNYTSEDINKLYSEKENNPQYKKFLEETGKETLAQIFTDIRYTKKDNVYFSKKILETLYKQLFMNNEE